MTLPAPELEPPALNAPSAALLGWLLVLSVGALGLRVGLFAGGQVDPDLGMPDWRPADALLDRLEAARAERLRRLPPATAEDVLALEEAHRALNAAELAHRRAPAAPALGEARALFQVRAKALAAARGTDAYLALGTRLARELALALSAGDEARQTSLSGGFAGEARATGMVAGGRGLDRATGELVQVAFLTRWIAALGDGQAIERLIDSESRALFLAWKVGAHRGLDLRRRAELARELERLGSPYPVYRALGAWAADARQWRAAAAFYRRALVRSPNDPVLEANLARMVALELEPVGKAP